MQKQIEEFGKTIDIEIKKNEVIFPCGESIGFYDIKLVNKYWKERSHEHVQFCKACRVVLGLSKRKTGFAQQEVAQLFEKGIDDKSSSTGNFHSENGILFHYRTIEALRTDKGLIISNNQCFSRGYARCSKPNHVDLSLPLTSLDRFNAKSIEILEINQDAEVLFTTLSKDGLGITKYWLYGIDSEEARRFLVILVKPVSTIKEAYESMKPREVNKAIEQGLDVKRQGDLFFIPLSDKLSKVKPKQITKRTKTPCKRAYYQCQKCGVKTKRFVTEETEIVNNEETRYRNVDTIRYKKYHPWVYAWSNLPQKMKDCNGTSEDMKLIEYDSFKYSDFPEIELPLKDNTTLKTRHTATKTARLNGFTVVKGCVRHPEHRTLKLETWHSVIKNQVKRSIPLTGGID